MAETIYRVTGCPRIALIADSHNRPMSDAMASIRKHRIDLIFIAGDFVYGNVLRMTIQMYLCQEQMKTQQSGFPDLNLKTGKS